MVSEAALLLFYLLQNYQLLQPVQLLPHVRVTEKASERYYKEAGKEKFAKREAPESDGGDRCCAGILSDLFFDCDGFVYPADREKSCGGYL